MGNSKLKLTCHKLSPMSAHWRQGQSFFFLLAELPLSLASVNRCENRIAFTLDTLIPRCAFLLFPSLCVLRLFHRICIPPSSPCCCSVSDHPSTAMDTKFVHRLFIWYRYLFPLPNTDYLIFCTFSTSYFGRSRHTYFFRRKVSASHIVSSTSALLPELFQKHFRLTSSKKLFCAKVK